MLYNSFISIKNNNSGIEFETRLLNVLSSVNFDANFARSENKPCNFLEIKKRF